MLAGNLFNHTAAQSAGSHRVSLFALRLRRVAASLLSLLLAAQALSQTPQTSPPAGVGMAAERLAQIDVVVQQAIERGATPGAVVLAARRGRIVWRKAYGSRAIKPAREPMTTDTIFDVASLTKVVVTATSIMILVERGLLRLNDPASQYIPELKGESRERVTIELLLTHRSGYAPGLGSSGEWNAYDGAMKRLYDEPLRSPPDT
ncbi:MAG: beta-lactamase family protein, partial [Acidobacteria bacterium]|nr:beta-lactamase family protein [Acidobacteriota bacterium]